MIETGLDHLEQSVKQGGDTKLLQLFNAFHLTKLLQLFNALSKEIDRHKSLIPKPRRSQRLRKGV